MSAFIFVAPGCANLIGLGDFGVAGGSASSNAGATSQAGASTAAEAGSGADAGTAAESGGAGMSAGGTNDSGGTAGSSGGSAGTGGDAGAGGAACPNDCDDQNDCTVDSCVAGACQNEPVAAGKACGTGRTCDDTALCVRCRDTAAGNGQDEGCGAGAPVCTGTGTAATCAGCTKDIDCDDGNECTTEKCTTGSCVVSAVVAGQACSTGVCNGAANAEKCLVCVDNATSPGKDLGCSDAKPTCDPSGTGTCYACVKDADCASDNVSCTNETCTNHVCTHVPDNSKCTPSGDQCNPNRCDAVAGCKAVDITGSTTLIAPSSTQGNGSFEDGVGYSTKVAGSGTAAGWEDVGDDYVIYNCVGTPPATGGCKGSATASTFMANTADGNLLAWFGGTSFASVDELQRLIPVPAGTTTLLIRADTNVQTQSTAVANQDFFDVRLLDGTHAQVGAPLVTLTNTAAQTATAAWTLNGIDNSIDVSAQAGKDIYLSLRSTVDAALKTDFFIDNVRVTATVCK